MKLAYVSYNMMPATILGGVGKKIAATIEIWNDLGHTARWFYTGSAEFKHEQAYGHIYSTKTNPLVREYQRIKQLIQMIKAVEKFQPDVIYLRAGIYTFPLQNLFKIAPVVFELNTLDLIEYRKRGVLRYLLHVLTRNSVYSKAAAFVAVSEEIRDNSKNKKYKKTTITIGNGIKLSAFARFPAPENIKPRIVFIGTQGNLWHGLDKVVQIAAKNPDFIIDVIGTSRKDIFSILPDNINFHGQKEQNEYHAIMQNADLSLGSLALHRNNMNEASPLKVREYLAYGIPVIIAYHDTDLSGLNLDFILQLPNKEENVLANNERIRDFAYSMVGKRADSEIVMSVLDLEGKEKKKIEFIQQILDQS